MGRSRNLSQLKPNDQGLIETDDINDLAVTTGKMAAGAVTASKMANAGQELGMRNRIINGDMRVDQRNGGASVVVNTTAPFPVDRWNTYSDIANMTAQRSTVAPAGFINSLLHTVTGGAAPTAAQISRLEQRIEGVNVTDLGWGTANAQAVTISFWVRCSVTGTHSGAVSNNGGNRSYPFVFTVSSANTWEYKTVNIPGDTTGTWTTDNTTGFKLMFNLGTGTTYLGTAGAWAASGLFGATGSVQLCATSGATLYLTGVQVEVGTVATPFERRLYGQELALCQRYLPAFKSSGAVSMAGNGMIVSATQATVLYNFLVTPRVAPTGVTVSSASHFTVNSPTAGGVVASAISMTDASERVGRLLMTIAGATTGQACELYANTTAGQILFTGCEL